MVLVPALLLAAGAGAQTVSGFGTRKCSDYLAAIDKGQKPAIDGYISWAQGFISAHNWLADGARDITADPAGLTYWLVEACGRNRSARFHEVTRAFLRAHQR